MYIYITRLASNEIFSPSNKIHREVGRAKDFSASRYIEMHGQHNIKKSLSLFATLRTSLLILPLTKNDEKRIQNVLLHLQQHL